MLFSPRTLFRPNYYLFIFKSPEGGGRSHCWAPPLRWSFFEKTPPRRFWSKIPQQREHPGDYRWKKWGGKGGRMTTSTTYNFKSFDVDLISCQTQKKRKKKKSKPRVLAVPFFFSFFPFFYLFIKKGICKIKKTNIHHLMHAKLFFPASLAYQSCSPWFFFSFLLFFPPYTYILGVLARGQAWSFSPHPYDVFFEGGGGRWESRHYRSIQKKEGPLPLTKKETAVFLRERERGTHLLLSWPQSHDLHICLYLKTFGVSFLIHEEMISWTELALPRVSVLAHVRAGDHQRPFRKNECTYWPWILITAKCPFFSSPLTLPPPHPSPNSLTRAVAAKDGSE